MDRDNFDVQSLNVTNCKCRVRIIVVCSSAMSLIRVLLAQGPSFLFLGAHMAKIVGV